ncbi:MAG: RNA methyltransferase [Muribaculaceae bacterium]|nr:RNA methyltransferase [Muribaculaceae bacterium]
MIKKSVWEMGRPDVETFRRARKMPVVLVLDNVRSLNNIGSMFRTSDAFAVSEICLCGISSPPPSPEIHKTALGAEESVAWRYFESTCEALAFLRGQGYTLCALELTHNSVSLDSYEPSATGRYAIVVGNEVDGIAEDAVAACDVCLEIPQRGTKHSLNVAISASLALWHFFTRLELSSKD